MKRYVYSNLNLPSRHFYPTTFSKMMQTLNALIRLGVTELNRSDTEYIFGRADERLADELSYLGCEVSHVADLFNVRLPAEKFSQEEISHQKKIEQLYN